MTREIKDLFFVITDNKPGHQTQSDGVIKLLGHDHEYHVEYLKINKVSKGVNALLRFFLNYFNMIFFLKWYLIIPHISNVQCIYVISAGGDTLVPNVLLKRYLKKKDIKVKNIVLSSLRGVNPENFNVIFTVNPKLNGKLNYFYYPISPNKMVFSNSKNKMQENKIDARSGRVLILIGADTKDVKIGEPEKWFGLIENIKKQYPHTQIVLSTSRRTSTDFEKKLLHMLENSCLKNNNDKFYMYNTGEKCNISDFILSSDFVFISQDSGSMVSEVIMAEKKALLIGDIEDVKNPLMQNYFYNLLNSHLIVFVDFYEKSFQNKMNEMTIINHSLILSDKLKDILSD